MLPSCSGYEENLRKRQSEVFDNAANEQCEEVQAGLTSISDFPKIARVLFMNPTFVCVCLCGAADGWLHFIKGDVMFDLNVMSFFQVCYSLAS